MHSSVALADALDDEAFSHGIEHDLGSVMQVEFLHEVAAVRFDR
jgi:hypothetical protein